MARLAHNKDAKWMSRVKMALFLSIQLCTLAPKTHINKWPVKESSLSNSWPFGNFCCIINWVKIGSEFLRECQTRWLFLGQKSLFWCARLLSGQYNFCPWSSHSSSSYSLFFLLIVHNSIQICNFVVCFVPRERDGWQKVCKRFLKKWRLQFCFIIILSSSSLMLLREGFYERYL